jgi:hypothetical protein
MRNGTLGLDFLQQKYGLNALENRFCILHIMQGLPDTQKGIAMSGTNILPLTAGAQFLPPAPLPRDRHALSFAALFSALSLPRYTSSCSSETVRPA